MGRDESFKAYKRTDTKLIYNLELEYEKRSPQTRVIAKTLKLYESNLFGYIITKPMPTSRFGQEPAVPNSKQFNSLLETINLENKKRLNFCRKYIYIYIYIYQ